MRSGTTPLNLPGEPGAGRLTQPALPSGGTDTGASLVAQLTASQQDMIRLNEAMPTPSDLAERLFEDRLGDHFPALHWKVSAKNLSVRTLREEVIPRAERTPGGPLTRTTVVDEVPLNELIWRRIAGEPWEGFGALETTDIVHILGLDSEVPVELKSNAGKDKFESVLFDITPASFKQYLSTSFNSFWSNPSSNFSQGRNVSDWLALELGAQLRTEANLRAGDGTLSKEALRTVERVLGAPDLEVRQALPSSRRPGVYALTSPSGNTPLYATFALTERDSDTDPGRALLWQPGRGLQEFDGLTSLKTALKEDRALDGEISLAPVTEHLFSRKVRDLREQQRIKVTRELDRREASRTHALTLPESLGRAADVGKALDLMPMTADREALRIRKELDDWLHGNENVTDNDRLAWYRAAKDWQQTAAQMTSLPADPVGLATNDAVKQWTRTELSRLIQEKSYPSVDPDQEFLSIRKQKTDPHAPDGSSPFGSGVSQGRVTSLYDDRRSVAEWAMSNLTPDERNASHAMAPRLSFEQIKDLIETANVGERFAHELKTAAAGQQAQWISLKNKQMRAEAWVAHISGSLGHDRDNTDLNLVLAALDSPEPAGRSTVNRHEVVVRQLQKGDSVLNDVLAFGTKQLAARPSVTLYTPGAPDGKTFRNVHAGSDRQLQGAVVRALTDTPEMTRWLISKLPLAEQADLLASIEPTAENLPSSERIKKVTQRVFTSFARSRARDDFIAKVSAPPINGDMFKAMHAGQVDTALKNADALTVSNAERDDSAAQEGRAKAVGLVLGAMSMAPGGRLGNVARRAILPVMTGGAAVTAIKDKTGSASQWMGDFVGRLGDVLAEAGEDFIMGLADRRRGKPRLTLSSLASMPDPVLGEPKHATGASALQDLAATQRMQVVNVYGRNYLAPKVPDQPDGHYLLRVADPRDNSKLISTGIVVKPEAINGIQIWRRRGISGGGVASSTPAAQPSNQAALISQYNAATTLEEKQIAFKKLYKDFFKNVPTSTYPPRPVLPTLAPNATTTDLINDVYNCSRGLVLGETHTNVSAIKFLYDNLVNLKNKGVETIYVEGFNGRWSKMAPTKKERLKIDYSWDRGQYGWPYRMAELYERAENLGIRIIGVDNRNFTGYTGETARLKAMNYWAKMRILQDQTRHPSNWLAFVGMDHMMTTGKKKPVPGLAEILGAVSVEIHPAPKGAPSSVSTAKAGRVPNYVGRGDFLIELNIDDVAAGSRPSIA